MTQLQELQKNYNDKLIDLKYAQAVDLLKLLSDEDYATLCEDNKDLMSPISSSEGDAYLHRHDVLDSIIGVFTQYIEDQEHNPDKMDKDNLKQYITSLINDLDEERLRGIAKTIKTMLGLK